MTSRERQSNTRSYGLDRLEAFYELMDSHHELTQFLIKYLNTPRNYSTDEEIFMVEMHLLDAIGRNEGISVSQLGTLVKRTPGAISQTVNKLEKKGFLEKRIDAATPKVRNLHLTDKGRKAFDFHKRLDRDNYMRVLKKLPQFTAEEFKKLASLNRLLIENLPVNSSRQDES